MRGGEGKEGMGEEGRGEGKGKVVPPNVRDALTPLLTSDDVGVCLSRTSGLSREQRGLGRLKLAQR